MGVVLKKIIESVVANAKNNKVIPTYETDSAAAIQLKNYLPKVKWAKGWVRELGDLTDKTPSSPNPSTQLDEIVLPYLVQVEQAADRETIDNVFSGAKERKETEEILKKVSTKPPWEGVKKKPVNDILDARPNDGFLEKAYENEEFGPDMLLIYAVEIAYYQFPPNRWAEEACINLVKELYKKFQEWEKNNAKII